MFKRAKCAVNLWMTIGFGSWILLCCSPSQLLTTQNCPLCSLLSPLWRCWWYLFSSRLPMRDGSEVPWQKKRRNLVKCCKWNQFVQMDYDVKCLLLHILTPIKCKKCHLSPGFWNILKEYLLHSKSWHLMCFI